MDALGGLYAPTRQPNNPPNHSRKQKEPPNRKATLKNFEKTKRQYLIAEIALFSIKTAKVDNLPSKQLELILGRNM